MVVSGQLHAPPALAQGKNTPLPIEQEVGWAPEPVWTLSSTEKSVPADNRTPDIQLVARHYNDCAIRCFRRYVI
jgi:hypothetical protein